MSGHNELRQNVLTGRWTAVAPNRGRRPIRVGLEESQSDRAPVCPFCPGSEHELASVLMEVGGNGSGGWHVRVVPNRYPAFTNDASRGEWVDAQLADAKRQGAGGLTLGSDIPVRLGGPFPAVGYQEVIIETPEHALDFTDMPDE